MRSCTGSPSGVRSREDTLIICCAKRSTLAAWLGSKPPSSISPLGHILAVVEVTMGILRANTAPLTRAAFALRVVPGEFPPIYSSVIFNMARNAR